MQNNISRTYLPLLATLALMPWNTGHGIGIKTGNQDAKATARGNAFSATADNPSAIYYNPAGITQLDGDHVSLGAYFLRYHVDYTGAAGSEGSIDKLYTLPHLYYTHHTKDAPVAWGLGVYAPFGLGSEWSSKGALRTFATEAEVKYLTLAPVVAWKVAETVSLAVGPTINYGDMTLARGVMLPGDEFRFEGDGIGLGGNAGIHWKPTEQHAFGLTYRSAVKMELEGQAGLKSAAPQLLPGFKGDGSTEITMPSQVVVGYSFRPTKQWNFEANVEWTDWSSFDQMAIQTVASEFAEPMNWEDSYVFSFGTTRNFNNGTWLSAGYWHAQQTVPDATYNPRVPDAALNVFSIGAGYETESWKVGLTYQLGIGEERTVSGSPRNLTGGSADGTYSNRTDAVAVTVGVKF